MLGRGRRTRPQPAAQEGPESLVIVPDSIARNTLTSLLSHAFTSGLTALLTLFLVRALDPDVYGLFALATSVSVIVLIAADFGISGSTSRFAAEQRDRRDKVGELYVDGLKLKILVTGAVCLALALLAGVIADAYGEPDLTWPLRFIALATFGQSIFLMGLFTALGQSRMRVRVASFEAITEVSASIVLVLLGGGAVGAALGRAVGYAAGALLAVVLTLRLLHWPALHPTRLPRRRTVRRVGRYASGLLVVDTAFVVGGNANILLLGAYLGSAASGIYQAPGRLIVLLQYPGMSIASGIAPRMARRGGRPPDTGALSTGLRLLIVYQCALLAPVIFWGGPIMTTLLGEKYEEAGTVFSVMAPYVLLSGLAPLLSMSVNYFGEARKRIPISLATLAITVVTSVTLIPRYGLVGAAVGTNINFGFYTLAHLELCRRLLKLDLVPLLWSFGSGLTGAAGMALVLTRFDTATLTIPEMVLGGLAGLVVYAAILVFTREVTRREIRRLRGHLGGRTKQQPPSDGDDPGRLAAADGAPAPAPTPAAVPLRAKPGAGSAPAAGGAVGLGVIERRHRGAIAEAGALHEVRWRTVGELAFFELRPVGDGAGSDGVLPAVTSHLVDRPWGTADEPASHVVDAQARFVEELERLGWRHDGHGRAWYADRFLAP